MQQLTLDDIESGEQQSENNVCPTCSEEFLNEYGVKIHHKKAHGTSIAKKTLECENCGEEFERTAARVDPHTQHFCSRKCRYTHGLDGYQAQKESVECDQCGAELQRADWQLQRNEHNYCSPRCHKQWISENRVGENHPDYIAGFDRFPDGPRWKSKRKEALERDDYECQACGMSRADHYTKYNIDLHVHHIEPRRTFDNLKEANRLDNLVTLCVPCHSVYEGAFLSPVHRPAD